MGVVDIVTWLNGVLEHVESAARYAIFDGATGRWEEPTSGAICLNGVEGLDGLLPLGDPRISRHAIIHDPAAVLADVAAKRAIVASYMAAVEHYRRVTSAPVGESAALERVVKRIASAYSHWPGYDEEWKP